MSAEQAGIDAQEYAEDLREEALALLANHPETYRADQENRMLSMSTDELRAYLALRRDLALSFFANRDRRYFEPYRDFGPVPEEFVEIAERRGHDEWPDGVDPRCFGQEPDMVREAS